MVDWGRLLSGYRGEILGRRFESCPPRHFKNAFREERVFVRSHAPLMGWYPQRGRCSNPALASPPLANALYFVRILLLITRMQRV